MPAAHRVHDDQPLASMSLAKVPVADYIGHQILKPVAVKKQSDKLWTYGDGTFFTAAPAAGQLLFQRGPGSSYQRYEWDISAATSYYCENYGLEIVCSDEEVANADDGIDIRATNGALVASHLMNAQEQRYAALLFDVATTFVSYTNTPTAKWDADTAQPWDDRTIAVESMMANGTYDPLRNDLIFATGIQPWHRFARNPFLVDAIKHTRDASVITREDFRQYLQVDKFLVGAGTYNTADDGQAISLGYIWGDYGGFYSVPKGTPGLKQPSLGYSPVWTGMGGSIGNLGYGTRTYRDDTVRGEVIQGDNYVDEVVTQAPAGYVFSDLTDA